MPPRFHVDLPLRSGETLSLPAGPARHVQVLRLQPGAVITLFNGQGGEWSADVVQMGRSDVKVCIGQHEATDRELALQVTLAVGMPANERMDALVEKATELGVAAIQPLVCERSVLRLADERAEKKVAHWRGVAVAACEQSTRTRVPHIAPVSTLAAWLRSQQSMARHARVLLSLREAQALPDAGDFDAITCLSGPEGGLTETEEALAREQGFVPVSLGPRVLRADTAPLALLSYLTLR